MNSIDNRKGNGSRPIGPATRRGRLVIEDVVRLTPQQTNEGERRLIGAADGVAQVDVGAQGMLRDHAPEKIGGDSTCQAGGCIEASHSHRYVQTRSTDSRRVGLAPVRRLDG